MAEAIDLVGRRYSRLVIIGPRVMRKGEIYWPCRCDCGKEKVIHRSSLQSGRTKSCGCFKKEREPEIRRTHGHAGKGKRRSPEYKTWASMRNRCYRPAEDRYPQYGGRGIRVCDAWNNSFEAFLADMGPRPGPGYQIDREDNDGNYEPGNCRWVTRRKNMNNRSDNRVIEFQGRALTLAEWSRERGLDPETISGRLDSPAWTVERALTTPAKLYRRDTWRSRPMEFNGRSMMLREWAAELGISANTIGSRIDLYGWSVERALSTPSKGRPPRAA